MKTDPRVRYTRMIIQTAFLELLQQKPVNKITVREICEKAEINRSTFYKHYLDCYDLLDNLKEDAAVQLEEKLSTIEADGAMPALTAILQTIEDNARLFEIFFRSGGSREFTMQLVRLCFRFMDLHLAVSTDSAKDDVQRAMDFSFLIGGVGGVTEYWIQDGCRVPKEQIAAAILRLSKIMVDGLEGR